MRPVAPHTLVVFVAAVSCTLGALSPWIRAGADSTPFDLLGAAHGGAASVTETPDDAGDTFGSVLAASIDGIVEVPLSEVFADPEPFLGRTIRFTCQLEEIPQTWNPYLTRFGRDAFGALRVWSDEQRLWLPEDYEAPQGLVFARRSSRAWERLAELPVYGRVAVVGVVRQVFLNRPWIEITSARPLSQAWTEGALIHASRGVALLRSGQLQFAANEFERARGSDLPPAVEAELHGLELRCNEVASGLPAGWPAPAEARSKDR